MKKYRGLDDGGFTLIELLIVIVIIGILAGVVITVINPAQTQRKARETVLRANVEKGCLALHACGGTTTDANNCDTKAEAGIRTIDGTPTGSAYYLTDSATPGDSDSSANASAGAVVYYRGSRTQPGTAETCRFQCGYDFANEGPTAGTGGSILTIPTGSICVIGVE